MTKYLDKEGLKKVWELMKLYANGKADEVSGRIDEVVDAETGLVKASALPSYVDDIMEFDGTVSNVTVKKMSVSAFDKVVYDTGTNNFLAVVEGELKADYYSNWQGYTDPETGREWPAGSSYGDADTANSGWKPKKGKIYVDTTDNEAYRWSGSKLVSIGSDTLTEEEIVEACQ